jgi:hypothetical protein
VFGFAADPNQFITSYQGFTWSGTDGSLSWVNGTVTNLDSGVPAAPLGYTWSNSASDLTMQLTTGTFTINSVDLAGGFGSAASVTIDGFKSGILLDSFTTPALAPLPNSSYSTFTLGWTDLPLPISSG